MPSSAQLLLAFASTSCRAARARSCKLLVATQRPRSSSVRSSGPRPRGARKPKPLDPIAASNHSSLPHFRMSKPSSMFNPAALQVAVNRQDATRSYTWTSRNGSDAAASHLGIPALLMERDIHVTVIAMPMHFSTRHHAALEQHRLREEVDQPVMEHDVLAR